MEGKRILAISSGGGHWLELLRLVPAFRGHDVVYATVGEQYRGDVGDARFHVVPDATRWNKIDLVRLSIRVAGILLREQPDVIITTGAAPGYAAVRLGKLLGARSLWLDSIANVEELSLSGQRVGRHADLWLTQWPHLAKRDGPDYVGAVL